FCSGVPKISITSDAPYASAEYIEKAVLAPEISSSTSTCSERGAPVPPNSGSTAIDFQPASYRLFHASLKPSGVITLPSTSRQPCASATALSGPGTSLHQRYASASAVLTSSAPQPSNGGFDRISSRRNCSNRRKFISRRSAL